MKNLPINRLIFSYLYLASVLLLFCFSTQLHAQTHFFLHDGLGSVVNTTDINGIVSSRAQFDAWGNKRYENNTTWNRFGFTGHEHDQESNLIYAKARYLDPDTGRFLSQDAWEGDATNAPSLHKYLYVSQNPTSYTDPNGKFQISVHQDIVEEAANSKEVAKLSNARRSGFKQNKFVEGLKEGVTQPDVPSGYLGLAWTFTKNAAGIDSKGSVTYRSHFGDLQFWHHMVSEEKDPVAFRNKVVDRVVEKTKNAREKLAKEDVKGAGVELGEGLHTVHDSYSDSHTERNEKGEIVKIQDYSEQDSTKHKKADVNIKENEKNISRARKITEEIINYTLSDSFNEKEYRDYLENEVFDLKGQESGEVEVEMGGSQLKYKQDKDE